MLKIYKSRIIIIYFFIWFSDFIKNKESIIKPFILTENAVACVSCCLGRCNTKENEMNKPALSLICTLVLAACAGGGISEPRPPVEMPTMKPFNKPDAVPHADNAQYQTLHTGADTGSMQKFSYQGETTSWGYTPTISTVVYQTPDGKQYEFNKFTNPMIPSYASPSFKVISKHEGQPMPGGGKLFVCCTKTRFSYASALNLEHVRYGGWIDGSGNVDLFVGGKVADSAYMPGGSDPSVADIRGKATYEVWAIRAKDGDFVTSAYDPAYGFTGKTKDGKEVMVSRITANFNTNKLGGKILGNDDFGADINFGSVDIVGNGFSGTASSGGVDGRVEGKFFGEKGYWGGPANGEIGGKVVFDGDSKLNAVFGGKREREKRDDTSTDLEHLQ